MSAVEWKPVVVGRRRIAAGYRNCSKLSSCLSIVPKSALRLQSHIRSCRAAKPAEVPFQLSAIEPLVKPSIHDNS
jgi:hypothetical protein